jgi:hypothetical protein
MKRLNKEYKLDVCNHVIVKYGSVNKDNPQVIYVSGKCWVSPKHQMDYEYVISRIEKEMKKSIKLFLIDEINFTNRFILDFDINTDKFNIGNKKFLSFDFYLRQNDSDVKKLKDLKEMLSNKVSTVVNNLVYLFKENGFTVEKRK